MAKYADRVKETTTTTGTGTLSLGGALTGFQGFVAGHGDGEFIPSYVIAHTTANEWEVNSGTLTGASPDTLTRGTPHASSNSGSLVDFSAGTKHVFSTSSAYGENSAGKLFFARCASTANGTLATAYENGDTVDGQTLETGDIVLIKDQTTASENGLYQVNASGAPTRIAGMQAGDNASEAAVFVREGSTNSASLWQCTTDGGSDVVGTNNLTFTSMTGSPSSHSALSGLTSDDHTQYALTDGTRELTGGLLFSEISTPSTPATGKWALYPKTDGLYLLEDDGTEHGPFVTSSGGAPTTSQYVTLANDATLSNERVLAGSEGVTFTDGGAGGNVTGKLDVSGMTEETSVDAANDFIPVYDNSATAHRKVKPENLPSGQPFSTATAHFKDSTDTTKQVRVLADDITTGTTRTLNMPDQNVDLTPDTGTFAGASGSLGTGDTSDDVKQWNGSAWINKQLDAGDIKSGQIAHERGGIEADISAVAIGDVIAGTGSGTMGLVTATGHSDGDVLTIQADGSVDFETPAGGGGMSDLVDDTTPQLGGTLDCNGQNIQIDNGNAILDENGNELISFAGVASAVNYLQVNNGLTGNALQIQPGGDDTNISIDIEPKGTGNVLLGNFQFDADQSVSGANNNHVLTYDSGTGLISLEAASIDTLSTDLDANGNNIQLDAGNGIHDDDDNEQLLFAKTASAVNHWQMTNLSTGSGPKLSAVGDDTNIDARIEPKGSGDVVLGNYTLDGDQSIGAGQDDYVLTYDNGTGLISLEAAAGGSGSLFGLTRTAVKSSAYTAAVGDLVPINASGFSANVDFTFPATIAAGDVWGYYLEQAHSDHMATINRDSNTIGGETAMWSGGPDIDEKYSLCLEGDCVVFMAISSSDAVCIYDGITPHHCTLTKTANQGSFTQDTWIEVTMDTAVSDIGGMADLTNNKVVCRRAGVYDASAYIKFSSVPDTAHCGCTIWQNDGSGSVSDNSLVMSIVPNGKGASFTLRVPGYSQRFQCAADDDLTLYGLQSDATAGTVAGATPGVGAITYGWDNPRVNVMEVR